ncbi:MAG: IMP dehydrogenase [Myxococcota bacterium]
MPIEPELVGRTYDDFLLRPQRAVVTSRRDVSLRARLTRRIELELPVVSANMDSVTEARMARTMALEGGLGVIHRAMSIEAQVEMVRSVKRSQGYVVEDPLSLPRTATIDEARQFTRRHGISGILVEQAPGARVLAGLLSNRDMPWGGGDGDRPIAELMTPVERLHTAPPGIGVEEAERRLFEHRIEKLPLVDDRGRIAGLITRKDLILFRQRPFSSRDAKGRPLVGAAIGARADFLERAQALLEAGADVLVMDIAHAHADVMRDALVQFRQRLPDAELVCGNVGTAEGARFVVEHGADAVKVGIGPGRGCRTRLETAAGVPQLQAVREAWLAVGDRVPIVADGGVKSDKDLFLAIAVGASTVMLGSMLGGTDEAPGHVITDPATGEKRKVYRGMTSPQAVLHALYEAEGDEDAEQALDTPPEGQEMQVPYRGSVVPVLNRIRGHLRSSVSYAGERSLAAAREKVVNDPLAYLIPLGEPARRESYER